MSFLFRREHYNHALSFQHGHLLYLTVIFEVVCETQQQNFALLFEQNRSALEKHIGFHLGAFLQESDGVLELEVVVVVVGLRAETNFFHYYFSCLGFDFLGFFLLLVQVLLIVEYLAHRWVGGGRNLHQIEFEFLGNTASLLNGVYTRGYVVLR